MKKQVWRHKELARFSLNIEELWGVCSSLAEEFDDLDEIRISIEVKLPGGVRLEFESIDEMMEYPSLPDVINEYEISILGNEQYLNIECRPWNSKVSIVARSEKEGWCAGIIEKTSSTLRKHRVWHYWVPHWRFWAFISVIPPSYIVLKSFIFRDMGFSLVELVGAHAVYLLSFLIMFVRERILPTRAIRVKEKDGFIHCHATEITVIVGLITAIISIIGFLKS